MTIVRLPRCVSGKLPGQIRTVSLTARSPACWNTNSSLNALSLAPTGAVAAIELETKLPLT